MTPIYAAGIEWESEPSEARLVYRRDVLPMAPLTILFGANDSGKSTTLRVVAERLDTLAEDSRRDGDCTAIVCFRDDRPAFDAVFESLSTESNGELSSAARWTLETLAGNPRLFDQVAPEISSQLAEAPVFAIDSVPVLDDSEAIEKGRWQLNLVESPLHETETPPAMSKAFGSRRARSPEREAASKALGEGFDQSRIGPPHRPLHLGFIGTTGMPLVPRTQLLPAGLDTAFAALEATVEQAWHSFREWGAGAGLPVPPTGTASPWVVDDGDTRLDRFLIQLVGGRAPPVPG